MTAVSGVLYNGAMRARAFSLVELIVVVGIVALLLGISVPVLLGARARARALTCQSRQRQLLLALLQYDGQYGRLPPAIDNQRSDRAPGGPMVPLAGHGITHWWWFHYLGIPSPTGFQDQPLLRCPAARMDSTEMQDSVVWGNFGVNLSVCRTGPSGGPIIGLWGTPRGTADLPKPGATLLLVDSGHATIAWHFAASPPPPALRIDSRVGRSYVPGLALNRELRKTIAPAQQHDAEQGRHPRRTVNAGFADGHVQRRPAEDLAVTLDGDTYRNVRPLWEP